MVIKAWQRPGKLLHIISLWLFFLFQCRTVDHVWGSPWWDLSKLCLFRFILLSIYWEMLQVYSSGQQKAREGQERRDCCEFGWGSSKNLRFRGKGLLVQNMLQRSHKCWIRTQFRGRLWKALERYIRKRGKELPQKDEEEDTHLEDFPGESDSYIMWDREQVLILQISPSSNQSWASFHKRQTNT